MGMSLNELAQSIGRAEVLRVPVLIWSGLLPAGPGPGDEEEDEQEPATRIGISSARPAPAVIRQPQVLRVEKQNLKMNAFALGVTVGRTENNDVMFAHESVSRFHGYFRDEGTRGWTLTDAGSTNGTFVGTVRLTASRAFRLDPRVAIKFGSVEVLFLAPQAVPAFLQERARSAG